MADADTGFGNPLNMVRTVELLERAGADALQIEDQTLPQRYLQPLRDDPGRCDDDDGCPGHRVRRRSEPGPVPPGSSPWSIARLRTDRQPLPRPAACSWSAPPMSAARPHRRASAAAAASTARL